MSWGMWERWTDVRVRLTEIAGRVDQLLSRRAPPTPADAGELASGMVTMCATAEAVLMRVGTEHRATLTPQAHQRVCRAVGQLHTVAETLEELPALLDPADRWPP